MMTNQLMEPAPDLIEGIVGKLKTNGMFDEMRRDCLADIDTKPAFHNLKQKVENYVNNLLTKEVWTPKLNKNQLRARVRTSVMQSGMLTSGVEHILHQVVDAKMYTQFLPKISDYIKENEEALKKEFVPEPEPPPVFQEEIKVEEHAAPEITQFENNPLSVVPNNNSQDEVAMETDQKEDEAVKDEDTPLQDENVEEANEEEEKAEEDAEVPVIPDGAENTLRNLLQSLIQSNLQSLIKKNENENEKVEESSDHEAGESPSIDPSQIEEFTDNETSPTSNNDKSPVVDVKLSPKVDSETPPCDKKTLEVKVENVEIGNKEIKEEQESDEIVGPRTPEDPYDPEDIVVSSDASVELPSEEENKSPTDDSDASSEEEEVDENFEIIKNLKEEIQKDLQQMDQGSDESNKNVSLLEKQVKDIETFEEEEITEEVELVEETMFENEVVEFEENIQQDVEETVFAEADNKDEEELVQASRSRAEKKKKYRKHKRRHRSTSDESNNNEEVSSEKYPSDEESEQEVRQSRSHKKKKKKKTKKHKKQKTKFRDSSHTQDSASEFRRYSVSPPPQRKFIPSPPLPHHTQIRFEENANRTAVKVEPVFMSPFPPRFRDPYEMEHRDGPRPHFHDDIRPMFNPRFSPPHPGFNPRHSPPHYPEYSRFSPRSFNRGPYPFHSRGGSPPRRYSPTFDYYRPGMRPGFDPPRSPPPGRRFSPPPHHMGRFPGPHPHFGPDDRFFGRGPPHPRMRHEMSMGHSGAPVRPGHPHDRPFAPIDRPFGSTIDRPMGHPLDRPPHPMDRPSMHMDRGFPPGHPFDRPRPTGPPISSPTTPVQNKSPAPRGETPSEKTIPVETNQSEVTVATETIIPSNSQVEETKEPEVTEV